MILAIVCSETKPAPGYLRISRYECGGAAARLTHQGTIPGAKPNDLLAMADIEDFRLNPPNILRVKAPEEGPRPAVLPTGPHEAA
jgi:hypothetical protein